MFGSRRTAIDSSWILRILDEDGYEKVEIISQVVTGDLIAYKSADSYHHIGVVLGPPIADKTGDYDISVLSKWGYDGEYLHGWRDVPRVYGEPEFWTERIAL